MRNSSRNAQSTQSALTRWRFRLGLQTLEDRTVPTGFYSVDGTGNNLAHLEWGSTNEQLLRTAPAEYGNGISMPAGADRPGARAISNALIDHGDEATPSDRHLTAFIYVWGQFIDHDLDLTGTAQPLESFNVPVPMGDPVFDQNNTGTQVIPLNRSIYDPATGTSIGNPRQQMTRVTSWLDGSMIYGSDAANALSLRTLTGGKLTTSAGNLPPTNAAGAFLAGDVRANENVELTSMHTLFIREHNRLATQIAAANPNLSDEQIYQKARSIVIAEIQVITFKEWLPALLGNNAIGRYLGYKPNVNPGIANEFSTAAFRLHSTINDDVEFFDNSGRAITFDYVNGAGQTVTVEGEVTLAEAFNNPALLKASGVDGILKYAASTHMEEIDTRVVDSLRNFLFVQLAGGLDLASLNIQRGRDHGLADYNATRVAYGLPAVNSFAQITSDPILRQKLASMYGNVNNIDLWVGGLAEDHLPGSSVGRLFSRIIANQFQRLRDGDRFWYERNFSNQFVRDLERTSLTDIIERNTGVDSLQGNVFFFKAQVRGEVFNDRNGNGQRDHHENGMRNVLVQLLNDEGEVVGSTKTNWQGRYSLDDFGETGDYQVRIVPPASWVATTSNPRDLLISSGDVSARRDFGIRQLSNPTQPLTGTTQTGQSWSLPEEENALNLVNDVSTPVHD